MNIYLVERTDEVWYEEYASMVVVANNEEEALKMVPEKRGWLIGRPLDGKISLKCTLLNKEYDKATILHTHFVHG